MPGIELNYQENALATLTTSYWSFPPLAIGREEKNIDVFSSLVYSWEENVKGLEKVDTFTSAYLELKNELGIDLFNQLSYEDKMFLIETSGSIDFGRTIDLNQVSKNMEDIKTYGDYKS